MTILDFILKMRRICRYNDAHRITCTKCPLYRPFCHIFYPYVWDEEDIKKAIDCIEKWEPPKK